MHEGRFDSANASRRALLLALAASATIPLIGCAREKKTEPSLLVAEGVSRGLPAEDAPVDDALHGLMSFGHKVFLAAAEPGRNFVASPLSMAVAFAMARAGAAGATAQEIDAVFGFPATGRDAAYNSITGRLATVDVPPAPSGSETRTGYSDPVVSVASALFPQKGFPVAADFLHTLAREYGAGVRPVDFHEDAVDEINAWVERQTGGRIKKVFDDIDPEAKFVLANTVYFKADWRVPFDNPSDAPFTRADGSRVSVPTVKRAIEVKYAETGGITAIEVPYAPGDYAMWLMLAPPGAKPEDALAPDVLGRLRDAFTASWVDVAFPVWDCQTGIDLKAVLTALGVKSAFDGAADFSGIGPGLHIEQAAHQADITVDQWGTTAAAVTGLIGADSGPPDVRPRFVADRPFAYAIVGGRRRMPLFIGRVCDPSAK